MIVLNLVLMKAIQFVFYLLVFCIPLVLTGGCAEVATPEREAQTQIIENITPQESFTLIQNNKDNPDFIILDVRTPEEFAEEYIENAINIDFYSESFADELNTLDKNKPYLIYCQSGNRSGRALDIMEELNFREVHNMSGGIIQWKAEGLPITK